MAHALRAESRRPLDGRRLIAFLIDILVLLPIGGLAVHVGRGRWVFSVGLAGLCLTYYFLCESLTGQTLGKRLARLKVVRVDGEPLVPSRVATRTVLRIVDQGVACLVGTLTMIFSGGRRQRLGDLAARTAVVRCDAPTPRPMRRGRERFALYAYPGMWLAPFVLLYALIPDARVLPCNATGMALGSGKEGRCLMKVRGQLAVLDVANAGHTLRLPDYSVRLLATDVRTRGASAVVHFTIAVRNSSDHTVLFDRRGRGALLGVTRPDGLATVPFHESHTRPGLRIPAGRKRVRRLAFHIPAGGVPQLTRPVADLAFVSLGTGGGYPHVGELRLWRASTPAGMRALSGLHD